jgi:hypothetical protein
MTLYYSNDTRHSQNQGLITFAGVGCKFNLYNGTQPPNANTAVTSQVLLASLTIPGVFGSDVNGTLTLGAVTSATASNSGNATWFRIFKSDGTTVVLDGSVGISGADLNLNSVSIIALQTVAITSGTIIRNNQ